MWRQTELREALPPSARYPFMVQQTAVDGLHDIAGTGHLNSVLTASSKLSA